VQAGYSANDRFLRRIRNFLNLIVSFIHPEKSANHQKGLPVLGNGLA
jgi:hypothetical protein